MDAKVHSYTCIHNQEKNSSGNGHTFASQGAHNYSSIVKSLIAVHRNFELYSPRPHMLHHRFLLASTFFSSSLDST